MEDLSKTAKHPVKGVRTTLRIIEALQDLNGAGVTELASQLDLPKSSVHNYLSTLVEEEYLIKRNREYHVGLRFLNLGSHAQHERQVYSIAKPEVEDLAESTGELVNLLVEEHGRGVYIYRSAGQQAVNVDAHIGHRVHLHNTALGKAILAFLPEVYVKDILDVRGMPQTTENTITNEQELIEELLEIRERGIAFDREERLPGLRCAAAPITTDKNRAIGAISISGPMSRMKPDRLETEIPEALSDARNVIELNSTYAK